MEVCKGFVSQTLHEVFSVFAKALYVFKCSLSEGLGLGSKV